MKRFLPILLIIALCLSLCACVASKKEPQEYDSSLSQADEKNESTDDSNSQTGLTDVREDQQEDAQNPTQLYNGNTFTLSIREFTQRLESIAAEICPGMTVHLVTDDWCVTTELRYNGNPFCQLQYYCSDDYLDNPYPENPMTDQMLDDRTIRYVNLLDYVDEPHPENSFLAIAMTFDPTITAAQADELAQFLTEKINAYRDSYLVTAVNGIGYGYGYLVNQMVNSHSICIRAGVADVGLCEHELVYTFNSYGAPVGQCTKCEQQIFTNGTEKYLTDMKLISHSNDASGKDIQIGQWKDPDGEIYQKAMKFWVIDRPGFANSEYIEYALDGEYTTLCGTIAPDADSGANAEMQIEIYLDGNCIYTSEKIGYDGFAPYMLDIRGGSQVRIRCVTDTNDWGYCIVTATVF